MPHPSIPTNLANRVAVPPPLPRAAGRAAAPPLSTAVAGSHTGQKFGGNSLRDLQSFLISLVVHAALFIVLALINPAQGGGNRGVALLVDAPSAVEAPGALEELPISFEPLSIDSSAAATLPSTQVQVAEAPKVTSPLAAVAAVPEIAQPTSDLRDIPAESLLLSSPLPVGGGIEGRSRGQRARLAGQRGGTPESEDAVEMALAWLAEHQREDGSWSLKLADAPCKGRCTHPGLMESNTGATALALLPFLGAGYSHKEGPYQEVVKKGLYYLTTRMVETSNGGDLTENVTMYAQGIATIALCEGLAMSGDENLRPSAQKAVDFICYAQHPAGGWRYFPGQPGDTTVTGWQVMALKSARLAKLSVPSQSTQRVQDYLDSVQDSGAFYGYQRPERLPGPTAVGLLLRMYSGWQRDDERLQRGIGYLAQIGPSKTDIYFDYYATLVLNHQGGPAWERWNRRMRDHLVATQVKDGHERGSWYFPDRHGTMGGRLYTTAMAAMILEVYYRYMPLYGDEAVEDRF